MAGGGARGSRAGGSKRGAASSSASSAAAASACVYYATTALLVALCVAGAYFLTSTSSAVAAADGDAATVTAYRHTTRSSFAYEVTRERAAPAPPRGVEARDTPAAAKAVGAEEEPRPDDRSAVAAVAALDDPHARSDKERVLDEAAGVEEEHRVSAAGVEDVKGKDDGHVAAGDDEAASTHGGEEEEEKEREAAVLEESSRDAGAATARTLLAARPSSTRPGRRA